MSTVTAILINCGNRVDLICQINRMQQQTHRPDEVIVVTCCTHVEATDGDIVVSTYHSEDWGHRLCDIGLRLASMEYVCFVNSDDEYEPTFFEKMLALEPYGLVYCDYTSHLIQGAVMRSEPRVGHITRGSFIVRTNIAREAGYNHRDYAADGRFVEDVVSVDASLAYVPEVLMHHK